LPPTGAGADEIDGAVTATVMTAVVAVATCCGSIAAATLRGASLVAATMLPVTRGAFVERHLVGMDVSALSALEGARGRGDGRRHPANAKAEILNSCLSKTRHLEE
jgi:hypothetical protein